MPKLRRLTNQDDTNEVYIFWCPGCKNHHPFTTKSKDRSCWTFNGDLEHPTFSPSLLIDKDHPDRRCHLFMRLGRIQFLSDCHHELAGKTIDCPEHQWDD